MKILEKSLLENLYIISFSLFFIFNFFDRHIANIFLLMTLILSLINYKKVIEVFAINKKLIACILLFTIYISLIGYYHSSPIRELDNYYRFLLLLPILIIPFDENRMIMIIHLCAFAGLANFIYLYSYLGLDINRFSGPSSVAITYASMCATLFITCVYYLLYRRIQSKYLILSSVIFFILLILTGTRGPIIGIFLSLVYLSYELIKTFPEKKNFTKPLIIFFIITITIVSIPNPLGDRMKEMQEINLSEPMDIENKSLRERLFYVYYGIKHFQESSLMGIGPHNLQSEMRQSLGEDEKHLVFAKDHLHNEFLDISIKFGFLSLVLLLITYIFMIKSNDQKQRVLLNIIMIMLISSQLTQSHFSHHQAITFYIALIYILLKKSKKYEL